MNFPGIDKLCANLEWTREFDRLREELYAADDAHRAAAHVADWRTERAEVTLAEKSLLAHIRKARL